jgi:SAM-dependent methyltransferase
VSLARELNAERILEVGCGTGRWLADLRPVTEDLYGLDLSAGMLHRAGRRDEGLGLVRGRAGRLPWPACCFDLLYCVNAIHHFDSQKGFVLEARRLLRPGGALAVIGTDPRRLRDRWYVYQYFDGTFEADLNRFPSWGLVLDWMATAGFARAEWRSVERIEDRKRGREVLDDPFLRKDSASQLALLSDEQYAAGLRRIRSAVAAAEEAGETLIFPVDILRRMLVGWVSGERGTAA